MHSLRSQHHHFNILHMFLFSLIIISVGRPKHTKVMVGAVEGDQFIGNRADELKGFGSIY